MLSIESRGSVNGQEMRVHLVSGCWWISAKYRVKSQTL